MGFCNHAKKLLAFQRSPPNEKILQTFWLAVCKPKTWTLGIGFEVGYPLTDPNLGFVRSLFLFMVTSLIRAWDKEKILSPYEESNLRPLDSAHCLSYSIYLENVVDI